MNLALTGRRALPDRRTTPHTAGLEVRGALTRQIQPQQLGQTLLGGNGELDLEGPPVGGAAKRFALAKEGVGSAGAAERPLHAFGGLQPLKPDPAGQFVASGRQQEILIEMLERRLLALEP